MRLTTRVAPDSRGAGGAGGHEGVPRPAFQQVEAHGEGGVLLLPEGGGRGCRTSPPPRWRGRSPPRRAGRRCRCRPGPSGSPPPGPPGGCPPRTPCWPGWPPAPGAWGALSPPMASTMIFIELLLSFLLSASYPLEATPTEGSFHTPRGNFPVPPDWKIAGPLRHTAPTLPSYIGHTAGRPLHSADRRRPLSRVSERRNRNPRYNLQSAFAFETELGHCAKTDTIAFSPKASYFSAAHALFPFKAGFRSINTADFPPLSSHMTTRGRLLL